MMTLLSGTQGRTTPKRLDHHLEEDEEEAGGECNGNVGGASTSYNTDVFPRMRRAREEGVEEYEIITEPIGELVSVIIAVRHRHLTDDWYLRYVTVSDPERGTTRHFPCHSVVLSKVALRPGEGACLRTVNHPSVLQGVSLSSNVSTFATETPYMGFDIDFLRSVRKL